MKTTSKKLDFSQWVTLWKDVIRARFLFGFQHPAFVLYLVFVIILIGANGIIISYMLENQTFEASNRHIAFNHKSVVLSIGSYFVALLASASVDLVLTKEPQNRTITVMLGIASLFLGLALMLLSIQIVNWCVNFGYAISIIGVILALSVWLIANSKSHPSGNDVDGIPDATMGGAIIPQPNTIANIGAADTLGSSDSLSEFEH